MKTIFLWTAAFVALATLAFAAVPGTINYQGYLKNTDGTPVNNLVSVTFTIYPTEIRGSALWTETQSITPANGVYSVQLGSVAAFPAGLFNNDTLYLAVKVGADPEMTQRKQLTTTPYAFRAGITDSVVPGGVGSAAIADNSITTSLIADGAVTAVKLGNGSVTSAKIATPLSLTNTSASIATIYTESIGNSGIFAVSNSTGFPAIEAKQNGTGALIVGYSGPTNVFSVANNGSVNSSGNLYLPATSASAGVITAGGNRFIHSFGWDNFFAGTNAGNLTTVGSANTATGAMTLFSNNSGNNNTAIGWLALYSNTDGQDNTSIGASALYSNTTGGANAASGVFALNKNTAGYRNTANGWSALSKNTTGVENTAIGALSLQYNSTASGNTAVGTSALEQQAYSNSNTMWNSFNTAVGYQALHLNNPTSISNGISNTAIGGMALSSNTTGNENTASGYRALYSNTSGVNNTATGSAALLTNTTGADNTATGWGTLSFNTAGYSNTADGVSALHFNTEGNYNTASGYSALYSNTEGSNNTASGYRALRSNTTGSSNTASGNLALYLNTTGNSNTATGDSALYSNKTGQHNTAIGYFADVSVGDLINATAIGYSAKVNASNKVRIGNPSVTVIEGQVAWSNPSDIRLKKDVAEVTHGLGFIKQLHPVEFRMNEGNGKKDFGFIAQDIEALLGIEYNVLGIGGDAERTLTLRYTDFIAPMVKAIQEQQATIDQLKAELAEIRALLGRSL